MYKSREERFKLAKEQQLMRSREVKRETGKIKIAAPIRSIAAAPNIQSATTVHKRKKYRDYLMTLDNKQCGICKKPFTESTRFLHLDHCHTTGDIRGLLCHNCNIGLGCFKDNIVFLEAAIDYLLTVDRKTKGKIKKHHSDWTTPIEPLSVSSYTEAPKRWWDGLADVVELN